MEMFRSLCAQFYTLEQPAALLPSIDFYLQKADQLGGPVLEPMCGSGRYLIPLAKKGIDITGTDASKHMLAACREKCADSGLEVTLVKELLQNTKLIYTHIAGFKHPFSAGKRLQPLSKNVRSAFLFFFNL